jgi:hypothetical protein
MLGAQTLGGGSQSPISMEAQLPLNGMSLGTSELQVALGRKDQPWASQAFSLQPGTVPMGAGFSASWRLSHLKQRAFTEGNRSERIRKSLAAVSATQATRLSASKWKRVVEADVEDQY